MDNSREMAEENEQRSVIPPTSETVAMSDVHCQIPEPTIENGSSQSNQLCNRSESKQQTTSCNSFPVEQNNDKLSQSSVFEGEPAKLTVDMPPEGSTLQTGDTEKPEIVGGDQATENAGAMSSPIVNEGWDGSEQNESIYHVKWVYFKKKQVPIIMQNENGPCPLLAIINVLLLQNRIKLAVQTEFITASQLMMHLGNCILENAPCEEALSRLNFEQNMGDAMAVIHKLQTGLDVNVKFTGVCDFEYTPECIIFDLLQIMLYHGWLVDPQNLAEVEAIGTCSYNQLVEKIICNKTSDEPEQVRKALVAEQFLESTASQLTYHGLSELASQQKDDGLAVLFRNNHFTTLYKYKDELFQLVTDQGFLQESNVVWETLYNVDGDCHFVDSEFRTYTKAEPCPLPLQYVDMNSDEQIDRDFQVALSLQQEQQQQQQQDQLAWAGQNAQLSDEELAHRLQEEEEHRAGMIDGAGQGGQRRSENSPLSRSTSQPGALQSSQRRPLQRAEEKKSTCCIL